MRGPLVFMLKKKEGERFIAKKVYIAPFLVSPKAGRHDNIPALSSTTSGERS
jgi:hypothetical protein